MFVGRLMLVLAHEFEVVAWSFVDQDHVEFVGECVYKTTGLVPYLEMQSKLWSEIV